MYQYAGNCGSQIPLTSITFDQFLNTAMGVALTCVSAGAAVASAGSAVLEAGDQTDPTGNNLTDSAGDEQAAMKNLEKVKASANRSMLGATANAVLNSKGQYNHSGSLSSVAGFLGVKVPYLIIKRPNQMIPEMYGKFHGYPSNVKATLSDLIGYTVVEDIRLNIPDATVGEIIECERLLKQGVVL